MTTSIAVLLLLVLVGAPRTHSQCSNGDYAKLQPYVLEASETYEFNFSCFTNLTTTYPRWEINDEVYEVTDLPPSFTVSGPNVTVNVIRSVKIRCFVKTILPNTSIRYIYSNEATVMRESFQGQWPLVSSMENITFSNYKDVININIGSKRDVEISFNFSSCADPDIALTKHVTFLNESDKTIKIDNTEIFNGKDVIITLNYNYDVTSKRFYIPNMNQTGCVYITSNYTGPIIDDLSNEYCNFRSQVIDYKICIYTPGGSNDCFDHPCGNSVIYTSLCSDNYHEDKAVGLEVSGAENGTIVSIFCKSNDCKDRPSNVMVFNIEILTGNCDGIEEQCVCNKTNSGERMRKSGCSEVCKIAGGVVGSALFILLPICCTVSIIIILLYYFKLWRIPRLMELLRAH